MPVEVTRSPEDVLSYLVRGAKKAGQSKVTVIDVGANVGQTADILVAAGASRVLSFEPNPRTCVKYLDHVGGRVNGTRPELVCAAVGASPGVAQFVDAPESTSFMQMPASGRMAGTLITIPIVTLSTALGARGVDAVDVLKIDTQGREEGVLKGYGLDLLESTPHIVLEFSYGLLHAAGTDQAGLLHFLADAGFACSYMDKSGMKGAEPWPQAMATEAEGDRCVSFDAFVDAVKGGWTNLWCENRGLKPM